MVVAIGDELLRGEIVDANSAYLSRSLTELGFDVTAGYHVRDDLDEIVTVLGEACSSAAIVIITGGLGPTSDDITRDAVSKFVDRPLLKNEESLARMHALFKSRGRAFHPINERQAFFPDSATIIPNPVGTADAFVTPFLSPGGGGTKIFSFPGVPKEMEEIFSSAVKSMLREFFPGLPPQASAFLKCFGLSESLLGARVEGCSLPKDIRVSYRPVMPEVWISFRTNVAAAESGAAAEERVKLARVKAREAIGAEFIITSDWHKSLPDIFCEILRSKNLTISVAESCTGGKVSDRIVSVPGASNCFAGSVVTYANTAKEELLGVSAQLLLKYGAVSEQVAKAMASGVRDKFQTDVGLSITGIAGPDGGSEEKPVGTVWFGISTAKETKAVKHFIPSERERFRLYAAFIALDIVRRYFSGYPLTWESR